MHRPAERRGKCGRPYVQLEFPPSLLKARDLTCSFLPSNAPSRPHMLVGREETIMEPPATTCRVTGASRAHAAMAASVSAAFRARRSVKTRRESTDLADGPRGKIARSPTVDDIGWEASGSSGCAPSRPRVHCSVASPRHDVGFEFKRRLNSVLPRTSYPKDSCGAHRRSVGFDCSARGEDPRRSFDAAVSGRTGFLQPRHDAMAYRVLCYAPAPILTLPEQFTRRKRRAR